MPDPVDASTRELLQWIAREPRTYGEAMEAWRSNCPRHPVWDDACMDGLVEVLDEGPTMNDGAVVLTDLGRRLLAG